MSKEIYDVVTRKVISGRNLDISKQLSIDNSSVSHLRRGHLKMIDSRYCLLSKKDQLIFIMVDYASKEEFECLSNRTIFLHLNLPYNDNEAKYVYELRSERQATAAIAGKIFHLKGNENKVDIRYISRRKDAHLNFEGVSDFREKVAHQKKLRAILQRRILRVLEIQKSKKYKNTLKLVGCDLDFFRKYIENQFVDGMSWENQGRGGWNIDHIIPCNTFDLTKEEQQRRCFHYTNLRPLWQKDNFSRPNDGCDMFGYGLWI